VQVHDALDAVLEAAIGRLIYVRPRVAAIAGELFCGEGEGDVDPVYRLGLVMTAIKG
jgi:hypothetical protein